MVQVFLSSLLQLLQLFAIGIAGGLAIYFLETLTLRSFMKSVGWRGVLWTAWIGTPIHEISHAVVCPVFRHEVLEVKFFDPASDDGTLGYVRHSYDPEKAYQILGNFFIGVAPLIVGAHVLYLVALLLHPEARGIQGIVTENADALSQADAVTERMALLAGTSFELIWKLISPSGFTSLKYWLFLYLSVCIATHMAPSPQDMRNGLPGLLLFSAVLLLANLLASLVGTSLAGLVGWCGARLALFSALLVYSTAVAGLGFVLSFSLLTILHRVRSGSWLSPF